MQLSLHATVSGQSSIPIHQQLGAGFNFQVNLKAIWDVVSRITIGRRGYAFVVDRAGHLIAHPDVSVVLQKRNLSDLAQVKAARAERPSSGDETVVAAATGLDGTEVLTSHATIPSLGWTVFVEQPLAEALAPVQDTIVRSILILALGLVASVIASILLAPLGPELVAEGLFERQALAFGSANHSIRLMALSLPRAHHPELSRGTGRGVEGLTL